MKLRPRTMATRFAFLPLLGLVLADRAEQASCSARRWGRWGKGQTDRSKTHTTHTEGSTLHRSKTPDRNDIDMTSPDMLALFGFLPFPFCLQSVASVSTDTSLTQLWGRSGNPRVTLVFVCHIVYNIFLTVGR